MEKGQVILITVLTLGGIILGTTTIAGLLMTYQIRQSSNIINSTKAIMAADAGIEYELYNHFKENDYTELNFNNGVSATSTFASCMPIYKIISYGDSGGIYRAFKMDFIENQ